MFSRATICKIETSESYIGIYIYTCVKFYAFSMIIGTQKSASFFHNFKTKNRLEEKK